MLKKVLRKCILIVFMMLVTKGFYHTENYVVGRSVAGRSINKACCHLHPHIKKNIHK